MLRYAVMEMMLLLLVVSAGEAHDKAGALSGWAMHDVAICWTMFNNDHVAEAYNHDHYFNSSKAVIGPNSCGRVESAIR
jgi:hypothetical protein